MKRTFAAIGVFATVGAFWMSSAHAQSLPRVVPGSVEVVEGAAGSTVTAEIPVTLSEPSASEVRADWATIDTGLAGAASLSEGDYVAASGELVFAPGETETVIEITINGDDFDEEDSEYVVIATGNVVNAHVGGFWGLGFAEISDDDTLPSVVPGLVSVDEGYSHTGRNVPVPLQLSAPSRRVVTVDWTTIEPDAANVASAAEGDYRSASGTATFAPGETQQFAEVFVYGDNAFEPNEYVVVATGNHVNASPGGFWGLGFAEIVNDDPVSGCTIAGTPVTTELDQPQCDALVAIYNATDGPNWWRSAGWNTPTDPCDWYGVFCHLGEVTKLDLDGSRMRGAIPPEIGALIGLKSLFLDDNQITALPSEIGDLPNLLSLRLDENPLATLPPEIGNITNPFYLSIEDSGLTALPPEIGGMTGLGRLHLEGSQLTTLPPEIGNLTNLDDLDLGENLLTALPPEIGSLTGLTNLELDQNQLTELPPEIGNLTRLSSLGLDHNQLSTLPPEIGNLTLLFNIGLTNNQLTTLPPEFGNLSSLLWTLDLRNNQLTSLPAEIGNIPQIDHLDVRNNRLTTIPAEIANLSRLGALYLNSNQLTAIPSEIGRLDRLNTLWLSSNQLTELPLEISDLPDLRELRLNGNQLTGDITAPLLGLSDTVNTLIIEDGPGYNTCLTVSDPALDAWLDREDPGWDDCP